MPHAELKYSADLKIDAPALLARLEYVIGTHDADAGAVKGRAYRTDVYHHTHVILAVSLLPKAHRDDGFLRALVADLEQTMRRMISQPCYLTVDVTFSGPHYVTEYIQGDISPA